jgi:glucose/arabinose dehydrogenase
MARLNCSVLRLMLVSIITVFLSLSGHQSVAQVFPLGEGPWEFNTYSPPARIKVSVIARGIEHPRGMAMLPDGDILVAERRGNLRIIRDGQLDPQSIAGVPAIAFAVWGGLMDVVLHPDFEQNAYVYFTYTKAGVGPAGQEY